MISKSQVLVKFITGDQVLFDIDGAKEYKRIEKSLRSWFGSWIDIRKKALLRKKDIQKIFFFPEGYGSGLSNSL